MIWEQEVNSKKKGKKSFLQKLIYLANAFQNAFYILLLDNFGECYCLRYSGDKPSGICPKFPEISPIKLSSAEINRYYPDIAEFQISALIIKSSELPVHAALAKISYFFNAFPRALYFA